MNDLILHHEILGSGAETAVLLHGWGHSLESMRGLGELLAENYRVILVDLPGFGKSPQLNENAGLGEYVMSVADFIRSLGGESVILIGHSHGGRISTVLSSKFPELVKKLILIGASGIPRRRSVREKLRLSLIRTGGKVLKFIDTVFRTSLFKNIFAKKFGSVDYQRAGPLRKTFVKIVNSNVSSSAIQIPAETLLLWGEDDTETPVDVAESFHRLIANSELVILPGKGHLPFADAGAHLCAYHIGKFLTQERR